jgi:hypothetical protein
MNRDKHLAASCPARVPPRASAPLSRSPALQRAWQAAPTPMPARLQPRQQLLARRPVPPWPVFIQPAWAVLAGRILALVR